MDNLARCAMAAKVKGMSYGKYQALYGKPVPKKEKSRYPINGLSVRGAVSNSRKKQKHARSIVPSTAVKKL